MAAGYDISASDAFTHTLTTSATSGVGGNYSFQGGSYRKPINPVVVVLALGILGILAFALFGKGK